MKWRPENWGKIKADVWAAAKRPPYPGNCFEAGADAMLKALRQRGVHVDGDASFTSVGEHCTLSNSKNTGDYVFIPDDGVTK